MPTITAQGIAFSCEPGANLRQVLLKQGISVHNDGATVINCRGLGTCGTCAVHLEGEVGPMKWRERSRLALPPHQMPTPLRLACQIQVESDLKVNKYEGFWGQCRDQIRWRSTDSNTDEQTA
jgi:ferredoxin